MEKNRTQLKNAQNNKIKNEADSVWLSLYMDGIGMCKLQSTAPSTCLSRIQHLIMLMVKFWKRIKPTVTCTTIKNVCDLSLYQCTIYWNQLQLWDCSN
jgi:hypothetical protein